MLVFDAANIGGAPGTIRLFEGAAMDRFLTSTRRRSVHEVGLIDLLDMARLQDCLRTGGRCCASSPSASIGAKRSRRRWQRP